MDYINLIKKTIIDKEEFLKSIKYNKIMIEKGLKTLNSLMESETLVLWLLKPHYDTKYSSKEFLYLVFQKCELPIKDLNEIMEESEKIRKLEDTAILIKTNFKRTNEPIIVLAATESLKRIKISPLDIYGKNFVEEYDYISNLIEKHYIENNGELKIFKKITAYTYESKQNKFKLIVKK